MSERRICRKCGYGFYWPPLGDSEGTRHTDLCLSCDRRGDGDDSCDEDIDGCDEDFMKEIST